MAALSETIIPSTSHAANSNIETITGEKFKGAGYYGMGDGVHTVQVQITNFIGDITIQGTLSANPGPNDWVDIPLERQEGFSVDTTGLVSVASSANSVSYSSATTSNKIYNFTGNFVWIRAIVSNWTAGTVNRILLNR
jgi:hypothetical protein